jgi:hypothetical protein
VHTSLARLQKNLFDEKNPPNGNPDMVQITSDETDEGSSKLPPADLRVPSRVDYEEWMNLMTLWSMAPQCT